MDRNMIYGYLIILGCYLLLFVFSCREDVSVYFNQVEKKSYPGGRIFLKAAVWCIHLKKRLSTKFTHKDPRRKKPLHKSSLGSNLKLLNPALSEKQQLQDFYVRQYSLVLMVVFIGSLLSLAVSLSGRMSGMLQEGNYINRKPYGQGSLEITLSALVEGWEPKEIIYTVKEQKYSEEETRELYREASGHLTEVILGENDSLEDITKDLELITFMEGYPFQISWNSSNYSLIHSDGSVHNEGIKEAEVVTLTVCFRYEDMEFEESFPVLIRPVVYTQEELLVKEIEAALEKQDQDGRTESIMRLPAHIEAGNIIWKEVIQDSSGYFFLLLCAAAVLIFLSGNKEVEKELETRKKELLLDYPEIVNKLTLYLGAGMTIRNAFLKMGESYKKQRSQGKKRYVYEEILLLCHELQSGVSETDAYTNLGKRSRLQVYRKLCSMLTQNLRRGSNDLLMMLRQETASAFEERKNTAKKSGEEAGTKLLLPMMMMLCIVMALIMIPAFLSFS